MLPVRATAVSCPGPACSAGPLISWLPGEPLRVDYMLAGCYNPALRHRPLLKHWYSISELLQLRSSPRTPPGHIISNTIKELGLLRRPRYEAAGGRLFTPAQKIPFPHCGPIGTRQRRNVINITTTPCALFISLRYPELLNPSPTKTHLF